MTSAMGRKKQYAERFQARLTKADAIRLRKWGREWGLDPSGVLAVLIQQESLYRSGDIKRRG